MKAAVMTKFDSAWEIKDVPDPVPEPGQVLIKIRASGLCGTDVHLHRGLLGVRLPVVPGHEPVGEIVDLGTGVNRLKIGDRVGVSWVQRGRGRCPYCQKQRPLYCNGQPGGAITWSSMGGGNSELMVAWAEGCTLLPEGLDYEIAAPLFCAGFTVASGYFNAQPLPGDRIAILGLGGLGHLALQYVKAKGHFAAVITHSDDKAQLAKELGADEVVAATEQPGKALLKIGGADIILNTGNSSEYASQALEGLLPEGRFVEMGIDSKPVQAFPMAMVSKQIRLIGSKQNRRADLVDILDLASKGKVKPILEIYRLDEINKALERLIAGQVRYRAVIKL